MISIGKDLFYLITIRMFFFLDSSTWSFFSTGKPHATTWYWKIPQYVLEMIFPSGNWLGGWAAEGKSVVVYNWWWWWFAPLGERGEWCYWVASTEWCVQCAAFRYCKNIWTRKNFLISHKNEARSCLGSVWCILVLQLFFFYMLKGIISTHKSLFLCLQKQTAGVMASRDPGDDRTSVSGGGPTSTGLTLTTTSVVYRPR